MGIYYIGIMKIEILFPYSLLRTGQPGTKGLRTWGVLL